MNEKFQINKTEEEAIVNYLSGDFSENDSEILNNWLTKDKQNQLVLNQFSVIWQMSNLKQAYNKIDTRKAWNEMQNYMNKGQGKSLKLQWTELLKIAAIFVIALFLGGLGYYFIDKNNNTVSNPLFVEYFSPLGSRSFVQLADGSKVWLNAGSTLKYKNTYGLNNRDLILTGEAFFEVEKNKELPFVVKTSEIDVIALGTKFNVKAYSEEKTIETTLIEGSVKIESSVVKLADNLVLKPNDKAVFTRKSQTVELTQNKNQNNDQTQKHEEKPKLVIIQSVEPAPIISWKDQRWVINNEKLGNLAVKLERRYDVNFIFDNEVLKEYAFRGTLEDETLEQIMEAIKLSAPVKYVIDKKTVYIMTDGKQMEKFKNLMMK